MLYIEARTIKSAMDLLNVNCNSKHTRNAYKKNAVYGQTQEHKIHILAWPCDLSFLMWWPLNDPTWIMFCILASHNNNNVFLSVSCGGVYVVQELQL